MRVFSITYILYTAVNKHSLYKDSLSTHNTLARGTRPVLDQSAKLSIIFVHPKHIRQAVPDRGSFVSKGV